MSSTLPSIWATMNSWFTPTILFLFLNLMIGTIAVISTLTTTHKPVDQEHEHEHKHYQLARSPSLMLQRIKSINFYSYRSHEPTTIAFEPPHELDHTHFTSLHHQQQQQPPPPPPLSRSPSLLQRLKSITSLHHQTQDHHHQKQQQPPPPPPLSRSPSLLQRLKSINLKNYLPLDNPITHFSQEAPKDTLCSQPSTLRTRKLETTPKRESLYNHEQEKPNEEFEEENRDKVGTEETLDEIYSKLHKLPRTMKKSASTKLGFNQSKEDDIDVVESMRPATVRESKNTKPIAEMDDAEVDAKADDFINRFKQQLKLQRIDSIIRYKETISKKY